MACGLIRTEVGDPAVVREMRAELATISAANSRVT